MARESKYVTLTQNILLEYVYDDDNLKREDYNIITNLNIDEKSYTSKIGKNIIDNTIFPIDPILKKYAKVDNDKYSFLKIANYQTNYIHFDTVRLHLPTTYSFVDNNMVGLYLKIYTYDYENKKMVNLSSYLYDDTEVNSSSDLVFNKEFIYSEQQWGKYITFDVPSLYDISKQRTDIVTPGTINKNLSSIGLNPQSPIFFDFSWVISRQNLLGSTYYYLSDLFTKSISNKPEYQTLGVQVEESKDGDYFEIYGTYNQSNESLDDWVDEMSYKGRKIKIEYVISLLEENILTNKQTITVIENFTKKILYRPIITFSNTTALINVEMNVIDLYDNSQIKKIASIGLTKNIFKYGRSLTMININNAYKPKIYNLKQIKNDSGISSQNNIPDITLTKVNFPVIVDRIKILTTATPSNVTTDYKGMGLAEIIINPFGAILKFDIAASKGDSIIPYDLTKISENSTITLSFKDDTNFLEKDIWQQSDDNDFKLGTIIYKIDEEDISILKTIKKSNSNFYITIKGDKTGIRTLLYSGKFIFFDDVKFIDSSDASSNIEIGDFVDLGLSNSDINDIIKTQDNVKNIQKNKNIIIFLKHDANIKTFELYLNSISANIHFKKASGNNVSLTYLYFILNVSPIIIEDIKKNQEIEDVIELDFCIGKDTTQQPINIDSLKNMVTSFNCLNDQQQNTQL